MRTSKNSPGRSSFRLWIVALAASVALLLALRRRSWFLGGGGGRFSATSESLQYSFNVPSKGHGDLPVLAYWICGTGGDSKRMLRLLKAIYHPRNQYLLEIDSESSDEERAELIQSVQSERLFQAFGNANVAGKSYAINWIGSSELAATLHAAAVLLKLSTDWDWFINLSASDYPLITQDDLLHAMASLPRDLNFIDYTSDDNTDWNKMNRINQIVVDPSLHLQKSSHLFYAVETRPTPDSFKVFGGSPWLILSREVLDYCIQGWDNLPRKLLMYFANTAYPLESYFHTVLCNTPEFQNTTVNSNLRYNVVDNPANYENMMASAAAFARPFKQAGDNDDMVLNKIDRTVLNRPADSVTPGKWCSGQAMNASAETENSMAKDGDLCTSNWGNIDVVKPGPYGIKLGLLLSELANQWRFRTTQCHQ